MVAIVIALKLFAKVQLFLMQIFFQRKSVNENNFQFSTFNSQLISYLCTLIREIGENLLNN